MKWFDRILSWRKIAAGAGKLSLPVIEQLSCELEGLQPGQFLIMNDKRMGRTYVILEAEELEALLKRAGMITRLP